MLQLIQRVCSQALSPLKGERGNTQRFTRKGPFLEQSPHTTNLGHEADEQTDPSESARFSRPRNATWRSPRQKQQVPELVRMRHITVRYGNAVILQGIDWTVRAGESWALLGTNS